MKQFGTIIAPASIIPGSVTVLKSDDGTMVIGFTVGVLVLAGEFANSETTAIITAPLGSEVPNLPVEGTTLLVAFTEGVVDKGCYVIGQIPGGQRAIPVAAAGIAIDDDGLSNTQVRQPPKGVGVREYVRGAPFVIRLKGTRPDFKGEFFVEADDADQSPDGQAGTRMCIAMDPNTGRMGSKMRDAGGASVSCLYASEGGSAAIMMSPNGENFISVDDEGVHIVAKLVTVTADTIKQDGVILMNYPPGVPPTAAAGGALVGQVGGEVVGVAHVSQTVFIGPVLWPTKPFPSQPRAATSR